MAMTSRPASVSSCARIEPVHPSPMITASLAGSFVVMRSRSLGCPFGAAGDAYGRMGISFVMPANPVPIIIVRLYERRPYWAGAVIVRHQGADAVLYPAYLGRALALRGP